MNRQRLTIRYVFLILIAVWLLAPLQPTAQDSSLDYPQWRGPDRDGSAAAFVEPETWPEQLNRTWQVDVGTGLRHTDSHRQSRPTPSHDRMVMKC